MHGGTRNKLTKWWATDDAYEQLRILCDGKHTHAKWNPKPVGTQLSFPTSEEAAYPALLCKRVVAILHDYALKHGASKSDTLAEQLLATTTTSHRWVLDMLPKGKRLKPLVSEFRDYKHFLNDVHSDPEVHACFQCYPKGARLVHRQIQWGTVRVDETAGDNKFVWESNGKVSQLEAESYFLETKKLGKELQAEFCTVGIPRDPWDFLERAVSAGHPRTLAIHLNEEVTSMLQQNFAGDRALFGQDES